MLYKKRTQKTHNAKQHTTEHRQLSPEDQMSEFRLCEYREEQLLTDFSMIICFKVILEQPLLPSSDTVHCAPPICLRRGKRTANKSLLRLLQAIAVMSPRAHVQNVSAYAYTRSVCTSAVCMQLCSCPRPSCSGTKAEVFDVHV